MAVQEMFWGDRYGLVEDPYGHRWSLATHVRDLSPEQIQEGARQMMDNQTECAGAKSTVS
jgi:PhnB protein